MHVVITVTVPKICDEVIAQRVQLLIDCIQQQRLPIDRDHAAVLAVS